MAIIRIPRAAVPTGSGDDLDAALRGLAPAGSLAKTAGNLSGNADLGSIGTGLSGLLGLTRGISGGDPGQAIGGAANLGSGLAGLAGYPGVSSGLGAVGGPLTLATGLASGDPLSSTLGGIQTASLASGALGGPTLGSLAAPALEAGYMALPGATAEGLAGLGIGGGVGMAGAAALAPFLLMAMGGLNAAFTGGGDLFDSMFGGHVPQGVRQAKEYEGYANAFPGLAQRRIAGAKLYDTLGEDQDPAGLESAIRTAGSGMHANTEPAAWNLSHRPTHTKIHPADLSGWEAASPELGGHNAGAFLGLMDQGQAAGLDAGGMTGDWNLGQWTDDGRGGVGPGTYGLLDANTTGDAYRSRLGVNTQGDAPQTQEAQDLGNAVSGMGRHLGLDLYRGGEDFANFDQDQLEGYGLTPGNYGLGSLNYLRSFDPSVTSNPEWERYTKALDPGNLLADLDPLTLTPRKRMETPYAAPELNLGGM